MMDTSQKQWKFISFSSPVFPGISFLQTKLNEKKKNNRAAKKPIDTGNSGSKFQIFFLELRCNEKRPFPKDLCAHKTRNAAHTAREPPHAKMIVVK